MTERYTDPLAERYASAEMARIFSPERRVRTWRRLWVALAEAERELGLPISEEQVAALRAAVDHVDLARTRALEERLRHDVVAEIHAYGEDAPVARPIIHLGATSCYVTDNADLVLMREALGLLTVKIANALEALGAFVRRHRDTAALAYTHLQPAQPTTFGRRACLWAQDLLLDLEEVEARRAGLRLLGAKGATGTQASFLALFHGDAERVVRLDALVAERLGFERTWGVTGQTYPRKVDAQVLGALAGLAASTGKFALDVRLLMAFGEAREPAREEQVGSSAMPYKRNPMRSERICALSRWLAVNALHPGLVAAAQGLERTLDDSASRRLAIPGAFLAADALIELVIDVARGLEVNTAVVRRRLEAELPFYATEEILMAAVEAGGDRQALHERLRRHARAAAELRLAGEEPDLFRRVLADEAFAAVHAALPGLLSPDRHTGRAAEQAETFLTVELEPVLARYAGTLGRAGSVRV